MIHTCKRIKLHTYLDTCVNSKWAPNIKHIKVKYLLSECGGLRQKNFFKFKVSLSGHKASSRPA